MNTPDRVHVIPGVSDTLMLWSFATQTQSLLSQETYAVSYL